MVTTIRRLAILLGLITLVAGCTSTINYTGTPVIHRGERWAVLPFENNTQTPRAAEQAETITAALLRARANANLVVIPPYKPKKEILPEVDHKQKLKANMARARQRHVRYAITGSVNEWRYKAGLDGEPAVGLTIQLYDVPTGGVIWSAVVSGTGWSRSSVTDIAQRLIYKALIPLPSG